MKGINFEEWKALVKKNRQALNTKSNIYRTEPESLVWGAEKAVKTPEYGQVHTITYNVTGDIDTTGWPTEIKSGKDLILELSVPSGKMIIVDADKDYTFENDTLVINNVQNGLHINIKIEDALFENAKLGDYLYSDWTFGSTEKPGWLGRCVGTASMFEDGRSRWCSPASSSKLTWYDADNSSLTNKDIYGIDKISERELAITSFNGERNATYFVNNDINRQKYPAISWALDLFCGFGYLPSTGELYTCQGANSVLRDIYDGEVWTCDEEDSQYNWVVATSGADSYSSQPVIDRLADDDSVGTVSFISLTGKTGKPATTKIIYHAQSIIPETSSGKNAGLHKRRFNARFLSHEFKDGLGEIEFVGNLTTIGSDAFYNTNIEDIIIPETVTLIRGAYSTTSSNDAGAFACCPNLTTINIPNSVVTIGICAFANCPNLTSVSIGSGITDIQQSAFGYNNMYNYSSGVSTGTVNLTNITINAQTPPSLGSGAFVGNVEDKKIYVPAQSVDAYKQASGWSVYASNIEPMSNT